MINDDEDFLNKKSEAIDRLIEEFKRNVDIIFDDLRYSGSKQEKVAKESRDNPQVFEKGEYKKVFVNPPTISGKRLPMPVSHWMKLLDNFPIHFPVVFKIDDEDGDLFKVDIKDISNFVFVLDYVRYSPEHKQIIVAITRQKTGTKWFVKQ